MRFDADNYRDQAGPPDARRASVDGARVRRNREVAIGIVTAALIVVATVVSGSMDQANAALVVMGFDPDRAQLISSLLIGLIVSAAAYLAVARFRVAVGLGFVAFVALFAGTFRAETIGALGATGVDGAFDLGGWLLTVLALVMGGVVAAWAGSALGYTARPSIVEALAAVKGAATTRRVSPGSLRLPAGLAAVLVLLIVAVPAFGDLVNFAPDSLMRRGAAPAAVAEATDTAAPSDAAGTPSPTASPDSTAGAATPLPAATGEALTRPWAAWQPKGAGRISAINMTAPWKGGTSSVVDLTVYTPPGYDPAGSRTYPVLYEAPTGYHLWGGATNVATALDTLIDGGSIPATIVAFIDSAGGPFPNTECANSYDRRQWYDTFVGQTVVAWVDAHYKTIHDPTARAVVGMSEGGYCSAIIALHHPTVFGTAISFSGYFQPASNAVGPSGPFGANAALLANDSPTALAPKLPVATRRQLYFILVSKPDQPGYGPDGLAFEKVLSANEYPHDTIVATEPHGWTQVRDYFPAALESWARHEVATGVFAG